MTTKNMTCPHCHQPVIWSTENPFRPFCSERCKLIDLGNWASEKHRIAGESTDLEIKELDDDNE